MQAQENMAVTEQGATMEITALERQLVEDYEKLGGAEQVFFIEIMRALAGGADMDSMLIHQPHEYKAMQSAVNFGQIMNALPLMRYILARWGDMGDMALTLGMAYQAGIADGKRLDRVRRARK